MKLAYVPHIASLDHQKKRFYIGVRFEGEWDLITFICRNFFEIFSGFLKFFSG